MEDHLKANPTGPHILVILNYCLNESLIHHPSTFCTSPLIQLPTAPSPTYPCCPPEAFSPFRGPSSNSCLTEDPLTISKKPPFSITTEGGGGAVPSRLSKATPRSLFLQPHGKIPAHLRLMPSGSCNSFIQPRFIECFSLSFSTLLSLRKDL